MNIQRTHPDKAEISMEERKMEGAPGWYENVFDERERDRFRRLFIFHFRWQLAVAFMPAYRRLLPNPGR
jgi:hypothetical protein